MGADARIELFGGNDVLEPDAGTAFLPGAELLGAITENFHLVDAGADCLRVLVSRHLARVPVVPVPLAVGFESRFASTYRLSHTGFVRRRCLELPVALAGGGVVHDPPDTKLFGHGITSSFRKHFVGDFYTWRTPATQRLGIRIPNDDVLQATVHLPDYAKRQGPLRLSLESAVLWNADFLTRINFIWMTNDFFVGFENFVIPIAVAVEFFGNR